MRFNIAPKGFVHPRYLFFHKKWDREPKASAGWFKQWRRTFAWKKKVEVKPIPVPLARGYSSVDANEFVQDAKQLWEDPLIWPYERSYEQGSPNDPNYKTILGFYFDRRSGMLEGFKGAMNFTNTVLEGEDSLPDDISSLEAGISIEEQYIKLLERRLQFSRDEDCLMRKVPRLRKWPKLNLKEKFAIGKREDRAEVNIMNSFYDVAQLWIGAHHGLVQRRRLFSPKAVFPCVRDNMICSLNLSCDFISLAQRSADEYIIPNLQKAKPYGEPSLTVDRDLISIYPANWQINFSSSRWYSSEYCYKVPVKDQIHTIYLTDSAIRHKKLVDRSAKGRALMFCYGYGAAQDRQWHGNMNKIDDPSNHRVLENPVTLNAIFSNFSKNSIGFCCFQLNTTSFDSQIKNQVWFNGPYDIDDQPELILRKMIALNLSGPYNQPALLVNTETKPSRETEDSSSATV